MYADCISVLLICAFQERSRTCPSAHLLSYESRGVVLRRAPPEVRRASTGPTDKAFFGSSQSSLPADSSLPLTHSLRYGVRYVIRPSIEPPQA